MADGAMLLPPPAGEVSGQPPPPPPPLELMLHLSVHEAVEHGDHETLCGGQGELGKRPYLKHGAAHFNGQEHKQDVMQTEQSHQEEGGFDQPLILAEFIPLGIWQAEFVDQYPQKAQEEDEIHLK